MKNLARDKALSSIVPLRRQQVRPRARAGVDFCVCGATDHNVPLEAHCREPDCYSHLHTDHGAAMRQSRIKEHAEAIALAGALVAGPPAADRAYDYTTEAMLAAYLAERTVVRMRKPKTIEFMKSKCKPLLRLLPKHARGITHEVLLGYVTTRREEGAGEVVRKEVHSVLQPALKLAYKSDLFRADPAKVIPELDSLSKPRERVLTAHEVWGLCLYFASDTRLRKRAGHIAYAVAVGADPSAMPRALRKDIRDDLRGVRVHGSKNDRRERLAATPLPLQRDLVRWALGEATAESARKTRSKRKRGEMLFAPWANAVRDLGAACKALDIPRCSPNDFRRTYATWLGQHGIRDELIQRCMGQAPTSVLDRHYRKWTDDDLLGHVEQEYARWAGEQAPRLPADTGTAPPTVGQIVRRGGIEPPTRGFSVPCSTD